MKHLFDEKYETDTTDARLLDEQVGDFLRPLVQKLSDEGYSLRDLEVLLMGCVGEAIAVQVLTRNVAIAKAEREERLRNRGQ